MSTTKTNEAVIAAVQKYPEALVKRIDVIGKVIAIGRESSTLILRNIDNDTESHIADAKDCTLQLHRLEKISDEQLVEVAMIMGGDKAFIFDTDFGGCLYILDESVHIYDFAINNASLLPLCIADYLRSKLYDIDNLIETGIAEEIV